VVHFCLFSNTSRDHHFPKKNRMPRFECLVACFFPSPASSVHQRCGSHRLPLPMLIAWGCFERRSWKLMNRCGVKGRISQDGKSLKAMEPKKTGWLGYVVNHFEDPYLIKNVKWKVRDIFFFVAHLDSWLWCCRMLLTSGGWEIVEAISDYKTSESSRIVTVILWSDMRTFVANTW